MKIVIGVPVYNSSRTLKRCVEAIARQGNYTFYIYDNGSTDDTKAIIDELAKSIDVRYKYIPRIQQEVSVMKSGDVRNAICADIIEGDYLFWLDSDVLCEAPIEALIPYLNDEIGAVGYSYGLAGHLQNGACMLKVETAKRVNYMRDRKCTCLNMAEQILPLRTKIIEAQGVAHLKGGNAMAKITEKEIVTISGIVYYSETDKDSETGKALAKPRLMTEAEVDSLITVRCKQSADEVAKLQAIKDQFPKGE